MPIKKPSNKPKIGDMVLVIWNDAWSSRADVTVEEAREHVPATMEEIGFLVAQNKSGVTLCTSRLKEDNSYRYVSFIPRNMIREVRILEPKELTGASSTNE